MTHSQINPNEFGGFSRRTPNLNCSLYEVAIAKSLREVQLFEKHPKEQPPFRVEVVAMTTNLYKHFNPEEHKIESKISTVKTGFHCKYNINYHIIWIPKYRKQLLKGKVKMVLIEIIKGICYDNQIDMLALEIKPDHLHLFIGARPIHNPSNIIKRFKGNTSIQLRRVFKDLIYLNYPKHYKKFKNLWARGYYCGSAGHVSQEQVKRYIQEQEGKDVFEYDIFNCPKELKGQLKIGDFRR